MWSPKGTRGQEKHPNLYSLALIQNLENAYFPCFRPQDHITSRPNESTTLIKSCHKFTWSPIWVIDTYKHLRNIVQAYCYRSRNAFQKLWEWRMCPWCIEFLSPFSLVLTLLWQQQNCRGNRKGLSSLVLGRISSFGGVSPPSLNSPSLYLFLSFILLFALGVALAVGPSSGAYQSFLVITSEWDYVLAWWRGGWGQLGG